VFSGSVEQIMQLSRIDTAYRAAPLKIPGHPEKGIGRF
jgi:hypothetical protein